MTPRFSVLTPVFNPRRDHLQSCLDSVRRQSFTDWEHVIVDDASTEPWVAPMLAAAARSEPRIRLVNRTANGGIVAASREGLRTAAGDLVALLDHDDVLEVDALESMLAPFDAGTDVAYSDNDFIAPDGFYVDPMFKPDFSPERLRAQNYIAHLVVARRSLVERVGGFCDGYDGAQDHDLLLRLTEQSSRVSHVPRILYHWRQSPASVAAGPNKPWAFEAGVRAVADHCGRVGIAATVEMTANEGCYRVIRRLADRPLVSVIIPTRGGTGRVWGRQRCFVVDAVRSLVERSTYDNFEFIVVYDAATPPEVLDALRAINDAVIRLVRYDLAFNFSSKINLGAANAGGSLLLLLNDDVELIEPTSVEVLVAHVETPDVAMAGAKLLFADGTLQHGGHVYARQPGHACFGWRGDSPGPSPLRPLAVERECSGVTAGCALVSKAAFDEVGGFSPELPLNYNDADFSLKLRAAGHRIIWTPWASWYHFESQSRGRSAVSAFEEEWMRTRWDDEMSHDPYYNPNLAPYRNDFLESADARPPLWREP